jgi:hypothetical protein
MATQALDSHSGVDRKKIAFDEAMNLLSHDERFRATVYAMNTLLVQKGIYSPEEFEARFCEWAEKKLRKNSH